MLKQKIVDIKKFITMHCMKYELLKASRTRDLACTNFLTPFHDFSCFETLFDPDSMIFIRKSPKFRFYLLSLNNCISKNKKSYEKIKYTRIIYCSRNVHFRGLLSSNSSGAPRYTPLKLGGFRGFHL